MREVVRFKRPESEDDEKAFHRFALHDCQEYRDMVREKGVDFAAGKNVVLLPIGIFGFGMPYNTPFEVWSSEPCDACGAVVWMAVEWTGATVHDMDTSA